MGSVNIDNTGAGAGVTLSSDGTDLLLDGTAIGGGGGTALELYAENPSSPTTPLVSGPNSVAVGSGSRAQSTNGSTAFGISAVATANASFAAGFQPQATGVGSLALGYNALAGSSFSTTVGYNAQTATGSNATALTNSYASGADSFAAAIGNNTSTYGATGANSIAMGYRAKATGSYNIVLAKEGSATGTYSTIIGGTAGSDNGAWGKFVFPSSFLNGGQQGLFVLREATTDATASTLRTNGGAAGTTNQVILPNNSAYAFHGTIVARQQASTGTASAAWKVEGLIRREGSAGTTVLVNSATTVLDNTPAWGMALSADTTNGGLKIEVTGAAATNIRWVATINTSEVTY